MKKKLLVLFLLLVFNIISKAQPATDLCSAKPTPGDSLVGTVIQADTTGVLPGNSGKNISWDFSTLKTQSTSKLSHYYYDASTTPGSSHFPKAQIADLTPVGVYSYYSYDNDSAVYWGNYASDVNCEYAYDPQKLLVCPTGFESDFSDRYYRYRCGSGMYNHTHTFRKTTYDGYGTLILPNRTYNNVIRLKIEETTYDTTFVSGYTFGILSTATYYSWNDVNNPKPYKANLLNILYINSAGSSYKGVTYNDVPLITGVVTNELSSLEITVSPNPIEEESMISFNVGSRSGSGVNLTIYDMLGRSVLMANNIATGPNGRSEVKFRKGNLQSGIYWCRISAGTEKYKVQKLIIK